MTLEPPKKNTRIPSRAVLLGGELNRDFCTGIYIYIIIPLTTETFFSTAHSSFWRSSDLKMPKTAEAKTIQSCEPQRNLLLPIILVV